MSVLIDPSDDAGRRDPWPSPTAAWMDPPWLMSGRVITAWFSIPWEILAGALSPDLWPTASPTVRTRLRFYDVSFTALSSPHAHTLAPREGHFREAVIGVPSRFKGVDGEVSLFMWSDSDTYTAWAREVFGWPVLRGTFGLRGSVWEAAIAVGATGAAYLEADAGRASIEAIDVAADVAAGSPRAVWLVPRRIPFHGPANGDWRDVLVVRPETRQPGARFTGRCRVELAFASPHPLGALTAIDAELDVASGFELVVGRSVERI